MIFNLGQNATGKMRGKSLFMKDSADGKYKNIKLVGASVQNGTPTSDNPVDIVSNTVKSITGYGNNFINVKANTSSTINGFAVSVESGYILTVNGTPTNVWANLTDFAEINIPSGKYTFSVDSVPNGLNGIGIKFRKSIEDSTNVTHVITGSKKSVALDYSNEFKLVQIYADGCDTSINYNFTIKVMLNAGETALSFEPYKAIMAELSETYTLNGINGVYDYIDFERGVRVQRFGVHVLDGSDDERWHARETMTSGKFRNTTLILQNLAKPFNTAVSANLLCTSYSSIPSNSSGTWGENQGICIDGTSAVMIYDEKYNTSDISLWKAHLASNPLTLVYELAEPIETPLTEAELIAFKSLRTYSSGSSLLNDGGCDMEAEYFLANNIGQAMADVHMNTPHYVLDGSTLNIIL